MFKKYEGKYDPMIEFGRKWSKRVLFGSFWVSILIPLLFSDSYLSSSKVFESLYLLVSSVVPGVARISSTSQFHVLTATVFSLNWLLVPFYFVLFSMSLPFWNNEAAGFVLQRFHQKKGFLKYFAPPVFFGLLLLSDWGVFPGFGAYSMSGYQGLFNFGLMHVLDSSRFTVPIIYWAASAFEGMLYGGTVFWIGCSVRSMLHYQPAVTRKSAGHHP